MDEQINQWNKREIPEMVPCIYEKLIYDRNCIIITNIWGK